MHRLLHDAQRRKIRTNAARRIALQELSIERAMKELVEIFTDLEKSGTA
jgi:hypothetical protein